MTGTTISPERRVALLARAPADEVVELAERIISSVGPPTVLAGPDVGMVMMQVREPVAAERFHLGEVVVTSADVDLGGARGWAMRLGRDCVATLAAAVCDAAADSTDLGAEVADLCARTHYKLEVASHDEWARLAPTEVRFEVID